MDKDTIKAALSERGLHYLSDDNGGLVVPFLRSDGHPGFIVYLAAESVFSLQAAVVGAPAMEGEETKRFCAWWNANRRWPKAVVKDDGGLVLLGDLPDAGELPESYVGHWFDVQVSASFQFADELSVAAKVDIKVGG